MRARDFVVESGHSDLGARSFLATYIWVQLHLSNSNGDRCHILSYYLIFISKFVGHCVEIFEENILRLIRSHRWLMFSQIFKRIRPITLVRLLQEREAQKVVYRFGCAFLG